jgi:hypothetical protein
MIEIGKKYIVTLKKGVDCVHFEHEMIREGECHDCVPDRCVHISNPKPASLRSTEYVLSPDEAELLKKHPDVLAVEEDTGVLFKDVFARQFNYFNRQPNQNNWDTNWGLRRTNIESHESYNQGAAYDYVLDGTGVDIIIQDNGVYYDHPEFLDFDGNSRFNDIDWYAETGMPGTMPVGHYSSPKYHGTHVAGISAGLNYGFAKNAQIYSIRFDLMPTGDEFDLVRLWHEQKPIDPVTGVKRPTIVNASWGYSWYWPGWYTDGNYITNINFRGVDHPNVDPGPEYMFSPYTRHPFQFAAIDAACQDMIDAGVIFVAAAGNSKYKHDVPGGQDYNNYYTAGLGWPDPTDPIYQAGEPIYYNRPGSPSATNAIITGNISSILTNDNEEIPSSSSERGPAVNIWAPGTEITSCGSPDADGDLGIIINGLNGKYRDQSQFSTLTISGTSMASPQVTGILALFLQLNPRATQDDCLKFLLEKASKPVLSDSGTDNASDSRSLLGSAPNVLYNPFAAKDVMRINYDEASLTSYLLEIDNASLQELSETSSTVTLTTTGVQPGTEVSYTIDNISDSDIKEPTTGKFVINDQGVSTITVTANKDMENDGEKVGTIRLNNNEASVFFTINNDSFTNVSASIVELTGVNSDGSVYEGSTINMRLEADNMIGMDYDFQIRWAFIGGSADGADIQPYLGMYNWSYHSFNDIIVPVGTAPYIELQWQVADDNQYEGTETITLEIRDNRLGDGNWDSLLYRDTLAILPKPVPGWVATFSGGQVDSNGHYIQPTNFTITLTATNPVTGEPDPTMAPPGTRVWYKSQGNAQPGSDFSGMSSQGSLTVNNNNGTISIPISINPGSETYPETVQIFLFDNSNYAYPVIDQFVFNIAPNGATPV